MPRLVIYLTVVFNIPVQLTTYIPNKWKKIKGLESPLRINFVHKWEILVSAAVVNIMCKYWCLSAV